MGKNEFLSFSFSLSLAVGRYEPRGGELSKRVYSLYLQPGGILDLRAPRGKTE